jgi:hypothetical protein
MLECVFQFYLSQCYVVSGQLPVSVCLYQPLFKPGSYRKATLAKHYFCWVPVKCPPMSQVLSLLFLILYLHSKTTLCVHRSAHECVSSTNIFIGKCTQIFTLLAFSYSPTLPDNKYQQQAAMTIHTSFFSIWITITITNLTTAHLNVQHFTLSTTGRNTRTIFFLTSHMCH